MPKLSGVTRVEGSIVAGATVKIFASSNDALVATVVSDNLGAYSATVPTTGPYWVNVYKEGSTYLGGVTRRDVIAEADATTVPGAPTIGTAVAGNGYIDVYFDIPASNGGTPILDYMAKLSTGEESTGTSSPVRVAIPNGTSATARVRARNSVGYSAYSAASNSVTPVAPVTPAATVRSLWTGPSKADGAYISPRLNTSGSANSVRLVVSTSEGLTNPVKTPAVVPDIYRIAKTTISGLQANTEYWYAVEVDGVVDPTVKGRFKTLPVAGPASFSIALGCCANQTEHSDKPWIAIRDAKPLRFIMLGDWYYSNTSFTNEADKIGQYDTFLTHRPVRQEVHALIPTDYIYDDHDFGPDDATGLDDNNVAVPFRQASVDAFRRRFPAPLFSSVQTDAVDHGDVIGRVRFIVMDCRSNRSGVYRTDDATKSMLGAEQKARWKAQIDAAAAAGQVVCCISTIPWIGSGWGAYGTEVVELANYIKSKNMGGKVFFIAGDMHAMAYHSGRDYATGGGALTPVFQVGAMHSPFTSIKGGPYTQGPYGKAGTQTADGLTPNNYGIMEVVDDGTNLTIRWKGYDADAGVMRIRYSFAAIGTLIREQLSPQLKPGTPTAVAGNASATITVAPPQDAFPAITGITIESDGGGVDASANTLTSPRNFTGLAQNVPVRFRQKETNALGDSQFSDWSVAVTPNANGGVIPPSTLQATGGTYTTPGDGYGYWEFLADGDFVVTQAGQAEVLTVPGGGAGSNGGTSAGGGGGGGFPLVGSYNIPVGTHRATIGPGGVGVTGQLRGTSGGPTSLGSIQTVQGGGAGASSAGIAGLNGSSGGGGAGGSAQVAPGTGTAGQGFNGGNGYASGTSGERAGGGGGGAANAGKDAILGAGGNGGDGIEVWGKRYGGGGGGGGAAGGQGKDGGSNGGNAVNIASATANTGGGGGGLRGSTFKSGDGASGVVRIRKKL